MPAATLIIGIGNRDRGDDGAGPLFIDLLKENPPPDTDLLISDGDAGRLMDAWAGYERVIIVDACRSGSPPGTLHTYQAHTQPLPATFGQTSTHNFGLAEAVELARRLGVLPMEVTVYGVEAECFDLGVGMSAAVEGAVRSLREQLHQ